MSAIEKAEKALKKKLEALQDPEWDSSDNEDVDDDDHDLVDGDDEEQLIAREILEAAKKDEQLSKNKRQKKNKNHDNDDDDPNNIRHAVLYIGHLPNNFEEPELAGFLKQFGGIVNLKLVRSTKTGRSRGYAFCQFKSPQVARIVADTLAGYIVLGQKRLVCHVVPASKVHAGLFAKTLDLSPAAIRERNKPPRHKSLEKMSKITSRLVQREQKKREALKEMGIDYDFPGYEAAAAAAVDEQEQAMEDVDVEDVDKGTSSSKKKHHKKKRKDSVSSVQSLESAESSSFKKKRKDSISSVQSHESADDSSSAKPKKKKRKDSISSSVQSHESADSSSSKTKKKKKRKNSHDVMDEQQQQQDDAHHVAIAAAEKEKVRRPESTSKVSKKKKKESKKGSKNKRLTL